MSLVKIARVLMFAKILDGKMIAQSIHRQIRARIHEYLQQGWRSPGLGVVLVGDHPASEIYVRNKCQACAEVGIQSQLLKLEKSISEKRLLEQIDQLNANPNIDGILVQLPLPSAISPHLIAERILPSKDVDGFHPYNLGKLAQEQPFLRPCTPAGIIELIKANHIQIKGLNAVVIGVSYVVGRPMILELLMQGCTVSACHQLTRDIRPFVQEAELLIVATGNPELVKGDWIKKGAIVIDVGMNRMDNGSLVGDVEFEKAKERAAWITPVPGGVGPMTVATLLKNTLYAYETLHSINPLSPRKENS